MSNAAIYIRWGRATVGRESKGLEVFSHALEYYGGLEKQKKIAAHRVYLATNGDMEQFVGLIILEGETAQLRAIVDTDEYKTLLLKAMQVVDHLEVVDLSMGDEVQKTVMQAVATRKQMGITT